MEIYSFTRKTCRKKVKLAVISEESIIHELWMRDKKQVNVKYILFDKKIIAVHTHIK